MRSINQAGIDMIKSFEGCKLEAYKDQVGVVTIGYGDTGPDVVEGLTITQEEANQRLSHKLEQFCSGVSKYVTAEVNDNQFAALVSFAYNLGLGSLQHSTLLALLNAGNASGAASQFLVWDKAGGKVSDGLLRRRTAEQALFLKEEA